MPHAFVSYVRDNTPEVERLVRDLRLAGVEVWFDRDALKAGGRWAEAIVAGIEAGGYFLACFSKEYASRERTYMDEELAVARAVLRQRSDGDAWLIPLLLNRCTPSDVGLAADPVIGAVHCVAMFPDWADGMRRILDTVSPERSFGRRLNTMPGAARPRADGKAPMLALDFGTSHSLLAYRDEMLEWSAVRGADGRSLHPSVVTFADNWDYWVCSEGAEAASRRPDRSVQHIKRLLAAGREVTVGHKRFDAVTLASLVIRHLRDCAEQQLGVPVEQVITSAPAEYNWEQQAALVSACERAGLKVYRLIPESNAAGLLVSDWVKERPDIRKRLEVEFQGDMPVLVVDVGGGTTDISVVLVSLLDGDFAHEVLLTIGDNELGGLDYDAAIHSVIRAAYIDPLIAKGLRWTAADDQRLQLQARHAKEMLSRSERFSLVVADLETRPGQLETMTFPVDRESLFGALGRLDERLRGLIDVAVSAYAESDASRDSPTIRAVILGGQGSKVWTIAEFLRRRFAGLEVESRYQESAVSLGLSAFASVLDGRRSDLLLLNATTRGAGFRFRKRLPVADDKDVLSPRYDVSLVAQQDNEIALLFKAGTTIPTKLITAFRTRGPGELRIDLLELNRAQQPVSTLATLRAALPDGDMTLTLDVEVIDGPTFIYQLQDRDRRMLDKHVCRLRSA